MFATLERLVVRHAPAFGCAVAYRTGSVVADRQAPACLSQSQRPQLGQPDSDPMGRRAGRPWRGAGPLARRIPAMPASGRIRPANGLPGATKVVTASHAGRSLRATARGTAIR